jgi:hypothetical protein
MNCKRHRCILTCSDLPEAENFIGSRWSTPAGGGVRYFWQRYSQSDRLDLVRRNDANHLRESKAKSIELAIESML